MTYRRVSGYGALPTGLATASTASARLAVAESGSPEAVLAAGALEAALSGNAKAFQSSVTTGIQTVATVGAAAACAATGAGAVVAPICGFIGGTVGGAVARILFGSGPSCGDNLRVVRDGAANTFVPQCRGDKACETEVTAAAQRYAERRLAHCALTDHWSMESAIRAEAAKLGLSTADFGAITQLAGSPKWQAFARDRLTSEAGAALLSAKMRRWEADARAAKAVADAEYDQLSKACPKPGIRLPGSTSPCEKKAASTATMIAAQGYLFALTDGAQGVSQAQNTALRDQFFAEVAQDRTNAATAAQTNALQETLDARERAARSAAILGAASSTQMRKIAGIALLAAAALGGVYAYQKGAFR